MDVQLALNDIRIRLGLKGYTRKSSTLDHQDSVEGLSRVFNVLFYLYSASLKGEKLKK